MTLPHPHYGPLAASGIDGVARLARLGFGLPRELFDRYADLFGIDSLRCLHTTDSAPPVACAAQWRLDQWYGGRPVPAQAVAMVAVDPARRGIGIGSALMRGLLTEGRASGAAVALLCPSTLPFYRRLGFGRGGVSCGWSAPPAVFLSPDGHTGKDHAGEDGTIRPADPLNAAPLAALRRALLASENGVPERNEALWTLALCPDGEPADVFTLDGPDGPEGYLAITPPKDRRLTVADLCAPTPRSLHLARRFLAGYRAQVDRIAWRGGPDDPLALLADDVGVTLDGREEWLLRVLDVRLALTTRGYPHHAESCIAFRINDPLLPENNQDFSLMVADGIGTVADSRSVDGPVATVGIAAFSSLFTGHASAAALARAGLLRGAPRTINMIDLLFCNAHPWMADRF